MTDNVESSETTPRPWEFLETSECERLKWKNIKKLNLIRKDLKACKTDVFHDPRDDIKDKNLLNAVNSFLEDVGTDPHKISFSDCMCGLPEEGIYQGYDPVALSCCAISPNDRKTELKSKRTIEEKLNTSADECLDMPETQQIFDDLEDMDTQILFKAEEEVRINVNVTFERDANGSVRICRVPPVSDEIFEAETQELFGPMEMAEEPEEFVFKKPYPLSAEMASDPKSSTVEVVLDFQKQLLPTSRNDNEVKDEIEADEESSKDESKGSTCAA